MSSANSDRADHVVEVDPGHVLAPAGDRAADAELEEGQHLLERAARLRQDHARARQHDPHAELLGPVRLRLPVDRQPREEVVARGLGLVEALVAARSVPAARGLGHEHARPLALGQLRERGHEVAGREDARVADLALGVVAPALGDRLAEQVDDGVAAAQRVERRRLGLGRLPLEGLDAELPLGPGGVARERDRLVAARAQLADERSADHPGRAGDRDPHQPSAARSTVGSSGTSTTSPARAATSATAFATAWATSRLKTLGTM